MFFITCKKTDESPAGTVTDIEGNIYNTVTIGTPVWMAENLSVTQYNNGDPIPNITDSTEWSNLTIGAYCDYENDSDNSNTYGRLYNWYAINDPRKICPEGWHVSTHIDWERIMAFLGGESGAGGRLKEGGYTHWPYPNAGATNSSGFTALPGGFRGSFISEGEFSDLLSRGYWWCTDVERVGFSWSTAMDFRDGGVESSIKSQISGFSVRCVRD